MLITDEYFQEKNNNKKKRTANIYFHFFQSKNETANSDQNLTVGIVVLYFSQ